MPFTPINLLPLPVPAPPLPAAGPGSAASTPTNVPAPALEKAFAKRTKRVAASSSLSKTKRRRESSVKNSLSVNKATARSALETCAEDGTQLKVKYSRTARPQNQPPAASRFPQHDPVGIVTDERACLSAAVKPISVYASTTSMDALNPTSAHTSFNSVKANKGRSLTLYQAAVKPQRGTRLRKPVVKLGTDAVTGGVTPPQLQEDCTAGSDGAPADTDDQTMLSEIEDDALIELAQHVEEDVSHRPVTPPIRRREQNTRVVHEGEDYGGALLSDADRRLLSKFRQSDMAMRPIVRSSFQSPVLDRSPIFGASNGTVLRTCFRLGEALNTGSRAVRSGQNVVIELYARITSSWRDPTPGRKQHFVFKDLYHDNPPHMEGTFELWNQAQLWDLDSKVFLDATDRGIMCRVIAKMKRHGQDWRLQILNIWEANWADVEYVAGMYTPLEHHSESKA